MQAASDTPTPLRIYNFNSICEVTIYFRIYQTTTIIKKEYFSKCFQPTIKLKFYKQS